MRRRTFLGLMAALAAAGGAASAPPRARAAEGRLPRWDPAPPPVYPGPLPIPLLPATLLEWRYLSGRIAEGGQDFGFVVSIADYNPPFSDPPQLLVMREELTGAAPHATRTYPGRLDYDAATATYTFTPQGQAAPAATWRLDAAAQAYALDVSTPELTLQGLTLAPVGDLIPEAGTGRITTARLAGADVLSDYHADWVAIRRGDALLGYGRLDMQTIEPASIPASSDFDFAHHWFAVAGETAAGPVWVSAWRLDSEVTTWVATLARGAGAGWPVESYSELTPAFAHPVAVEILDWQRQPVAAGAPAERTGRAWRITAGRAAPGDLLDLTIRVPPGQFIVGARVGGGLTRVPSMQEAVTLDVAGSVGGAALTAVRVAVAESTFSADARTFLPAVLR